MKHHLADLHSVVEQSFKVYVSLVSGEVLLQTACWQKLHDELNGSPTLKQTHEQIWSNPLQHLTPQAITVLYNWWCSELWRTLFIADALVFDDILMVKFSQDVNLTPQVTALLFSVLWLQRLHSHQLSGPISTWVIPAQLHLPKMTLKTKRCTSVQPQEV